MRGRALIRVLVPLLVAAITAAGCGGDDGDEAEQPPGEAPPAERAPSETDTREADTPAVKSRVRAYLKALAARDEADGCAQLTDESAQEFVNTLPGTETCEDGLGLMMDGMNAQTIAKVTRAKVTRVTLDGDTAKAQVTGGRQRFKLERVGGDWKIANGFDATGLLIGTVVPAP
jgi:hypothetical protein